MRRGGGGDTGVDAPSMIKLLKVTRIRRALAKAIRSCKQTATCPMREKGGMWP